MSEEKKDGDGDAIVVKLEDVRSLALTSRVLRMFDTKGDKMTKSLGDAETT